MNKDKKVCIKFKFSKLQNFIGLFSVNKNSLYKNKHMLKNKKWHNTCHLKMLIKILYFVFIKNLLGFLSAMKYNS